jgi:hypothetical protein
MGLRSGLRVKSMIGDTFMEELTPLSEVFNLDFGLLILFEIY